MILIGLANQGSYVFAFDGAHKHTWLKEVQHQNGQVVVHAQGDGGAIHDVEAQVQRRGISWGRGRRRHPLLWL